MSVRGPQVLDGRIYEQVKDYLVALCQTELETYQTVHNTFNQLLHSSNGVSLQTHRTVTTSCVNMLYSLTSRRGIFFLNLHLFFQRTCKFVINVVLSRWMKLFLMILHKITRDQNNMKYRREEKRHYTFQILLMFSQTQQIFSSSKMFVEEILTFPGTSCSSNTLFYCISNKKNTNKWSAFLFS